MFVQSNQENPISREPEDAADDFAADLKIEETQDKAAPGNLLDDEASLSDLYNKKLELLRASADNSKIDTFTQNATVTEEILNVTVVSPTSNEIAPSAINTSKDVKNRRMKKKLQRQMTYFRKKRSI